MMRQDSAGERVGRLACASAPAHPSGLSAGSQPHLLLKRTLLTCMSLNANDIVQISSFSPSEMHFIKSN